MTTPILGGRSWPWPVIGLQRCKVCKTYEQILLLCTFGILIIWSRKLRLSHKTNWKHAPRPTTRDNINLSDLGASDSRGPSMLWGSHLHKTKNGTSQQIKRKTNLNIEEPGGENPPKFFSVPRPSENQPAPIWQVNIVEAWQAAYTKTHHGSMGLSLLKTNAICCIGRVVLGVVRISNTATHCGSSPTRSCLQKQCKTNTLGRVVVGGIRISNTTTHCGNSPTRFCLQNQCKTNYFGRVVVRVVIGF